MLFPQLEAKSKQSTSLSKHCWNFWSFHWKSELWVIICIVYVVEESGLLRPIIKSIPSFSSVRAAMSDAKEKKDLAGFTDGLYNWSSLFPITVTLHVRIGYGACLFLMQMSFTDRALLNQSLFRQIHERKFYIILLKFYSIKHKACCWITKSLSRRPLPTRAPAQRAAWSSPGTWSRGQRAPFDWRLGQMNDRPMLYLWSMVSAVIVVTSSALRKTVQLKTQLVYG